MHNQSAARAVESVWKQALAGLRGRYADWMAGMLILILIRVIALLPLTALYFFDKGDPRQLLFLFAPLLYVFVVLPLRFSAGSAMGNAVKGGAFTTVGLFSMKGYLKKLKAILRQALHLVPWALPLLLGLGAGIYMMYGISDGTVVLRMIISLGKMLGNDYGFKEGIYIVAAFGGLLALVLLYGMNRNGMVRFIFEKNGSLYGRARAEMLRQLKGRRAGQFWIGVFQSLTVVPVLLLEVYLGYRMFRIGAFDPNSFYGMAAGFFVLYWPLLPLRKALQAAYIILPGER